MVAISFVEEKKDPILTRYYGGIVSLVYSIQCFLSNENPQKEETIHLKQLAFIFNQRLKILLLYFSQGCKLKCICCVVFREWRMH